MRTASGPAGTPSSVMEISASWCAALGKVTSYDIWACAMRIDSNEVDSNEINRKEKNERVKDVLMVTDFN